MIYEKIRKLYEAGQTIDEIANHLEVSPTYIYTRLKKSGVTMRRAIVRRTETQQARHNEIVKLRAQGLSLKKIAEAVGISPEGVRHYLRPKNLTSSSDQELLE
jgi:DNA-binding CsgD family transcriptional regulator